MTEESLLAMQEKVQRAETLKRQIDELKKAAAGDKEVKMWGLCLYYDEEGDDRLYADLPVEEVKGFFDTFVTRSIKRLEREFKRL